MWGWLARQWAGKSLVCAALAAGVRTLAGVAPAPAAGTSSAGLQYLHHHHQQQQQHSRQQWAAQQLWQQPQQPWRQPAVPCTLPAARAPPPGPTGVGGEGLEWRADSVRRKRKHKMNKHKQRKRRKLNRHRK